MNKNGFTLIELLVVVSIIGILGGMTYMLIDVDTQKAKAVDAKKKANIERLAVGLESYCLSRNDCPAESAVAGNIPTSGSDATKVAEFISRWSDDDGAIYYYEDYGTNFVIYVAQSRNTSRYFKYSSSWQKIKDCGNEASQLISSLSSCYQEVAY